MRPAIDRPDPQGHARWTGPLIAAALGDVDVPYVWRFLRAHKIDLSARKSWCESKDPDFAAKAAEIVRLYLAPSSRSSGTQKIRSALTAPIRATLPAKEQTTLINAPPPAA